jgi:hypothetical protein
MVQDDVNVNHDSNTSTIAWRLELYGDLQEKIHEILELPLLDFSSSGKYEKARFVEMIRSDQEFAENVFNDIAKLREQLYECRELYME